MKRNIHSKNSDDPKFRIRGGRERFEEKRPGYNKV